MKLRISGGSTTGRPCTTGTTVSPVITAVSRVSDRSGTLEKFLGCNHEVGEVVIDNAVLFDRVSDPSNHQHHLGSSHL